MHTPTPSLPPLHRTVVPLCRTAADFDGVLERARVIREEQNQLVGKQIDVRCCSFDLDMLDDPKCMGVDDVALSCTFFRRALCLKYEFKVNY